MSDDPGAHQRRSIRLPEYDYAQDGAYFVTICTHERACLFGDVIGDAMRLNAVGEIAAACWRSIPAHFPHVVLDAFVVMPNHIHGIIIIDRPIEPPPPLPASGQPTVTDQRDVGAQHAAPLRGVTPNNVAPGSLGAIIRSYKSAVTRQINHLRNAPGEPVWQRNYYEHIIRSAESCDAIRAYILENPARWAADQDNPANLEPAGYPNRPPP